ncbi:hypothetical protein EYF80_024886 [Liparis tanakae]|uniref:Uncharacterized protein n=1 Tax=Liparis tanakae TaxID=230148 RepID=A0A4Z2HG86_9TELE|nr:hypothetical protein EYF80_024886 [Liparis tanakae]
MTKGRHWLLCSFHKALDPAAASGKRRFENGRRVFLYFILLFVILSLLVSWCCIFIVLLVVIYILSEPVGRLKSSQTFKRPKPQLREALGGTQNLKLTVFVILVVIQALLCVDLGVGVRRLFVVFVVAVQSSEGDMIQLFSRN